MIGKHEVHPLPPSRVYPFFSPQTRTNAKRIMNLFDGHTEHAILAA